MIRRLLAIALIALPITGCQQQDRDVASETGGTPTPFAAGSDAAPFGSQTGSDPAPTAPAEPVATAPAVTAPVLTQPVMTAPIQTVTSPIQLAPIAINPELFQVASWCIKGTGATCSSAEKQDPVRYRQILVLPTGYTENEYSKFRQDFRNLVSRASDTVPGVYSGAYRDRILYYGYWLPGGALDTSTSRFGGRIAPHPIRGSALTLRLDDVNAAVHSFRSTVDGTSNPLGVAVLFNSPSTEHTANASPPSFLNRPYGIAKLTVGDLESPYIATHELGHAALNFLDEYIEAGFDEMNVNSVDMLTPLAFLDGTWSGLGDALDNAFGTYEYRISEVLAGNGNENIDVTRYPDRVGGPGGTNEYEYEGGMFFGRGTWHDRTSNLMNSDRVMRAADDGFAYAHSVAQLRVVEQAFRNPGYAPRSNNRIRAAGPKGVWSQWEMGSTTKVVMYDGDKNHRFQPTRLYRVQVGWYERHWKTCWAAFVPYPCYDDVWTTAQRDFSPSRRQIALQSTSMWALGGLTQNLLCFLGFSEFPLNGTKVNICSISLSETAANFLPTMVFSMPYQEASVPADQWFTKYWWRFQTWNGTHWSNMTGWSEFERKL